MRTLKNPPIRRLSGLVQNRRLSVLTVGIAVLTFRLALFPYASARQPSTYATSTDSGISLECVPVS
jgi:hypothetical protein